MDIYLVGGAVRDELLGLTVHEKDWVVVGSTPEEMIAQGFQPVGKDFPVFLHPKTHEEYALARTERKTGKGYKGFKFYAESDVTLTEDLKRRDLTINAIAKAPDNTLIDPYGGISDIKKKLLRHVSDAFAEDPVRILRVARFASKLPEFNVHPSTNQLMQSMVTSGEVDALVPERVWKELSRALDTPKPTRFFEILDHCTALSVLFPNLINNDAAINALNIAVNQSAKTIIRFAVLLHNMTEKSCKAFCHHYRIPNDFKELALLVIKQLHHTLTLNLSDHESVLRFLKQTDGLRRKARFIDFLDSCAIINPAVTDLKPKLLRALAIVKNVDIKPLLEKGLTGMDFANALTKKQIEALEKEV